MSQTTTMRVETCDGNRYVFAFEGPEEDGVHFTAKSKFENFLTRQTIAVTVGNEVLVIPMHQVKSIVLAPPQGKSLELIAPKVTLVESTNDRLLGCQ